MIRIHLSLTVNAWLYLSRPHKGEVMIIFGWHLLAQAPALVLISSLFTWV